MTPPLRLSDLLQDSSAAPKGLSLAELMNSGEEEEEESGLSKFMKGGKTGLKKGIKSTIRTLGAAASGDLGSIINNQVANEIDKARTPASSGGAETFGRVAGQLAAELPAYMLGGGVAKGTGVTAKLLSKMAPASSKLGAFGKTALASVPEQILGGTVTEAALHQDEVNSPAAIARVVAYSALGSAVDGLLGIRQFNKLAGQIGASSGQVVGEVVDAAAIVNQKVSVDREGFFKGIDDILDQYKQLTYGDPLVNPAPKQVKPFNSNRIDLVDARGTRVWNPKKQTVPNDVNVSGYAEEIAADIAQRDKLVARTSKVLDNIKRGTHNKTGLDKLVKDQDDILALSERISLNVQKLGMSAEEVRGLLSSNPAGTKSVVKMGSQTEKNFGVKGLKELEPTPSPYKVNRAIETDITKPGSGDSSPYAYVAPEAPTGDPLLGVLSPTVEGSGHQFSGLSEAENMIAKNIDYGNANATAARLQDRLLLDTFTKQADFKGLDFLRPLKEVGQEVYNLASRMLRINMKLQSSIDDAIYIPVEGGGYVRGAESLVPALKFIGADAQSALKYQLYIHARQALSGVDTPFNKEAAQKVVEEYVREQPAIVEAYARFHQPLMADMLKMIHGYELMPTVAKEALEVNPEFASLSRAAFGDPSASTGMMKSRKNPTSALVVGDYFHTVMSNVRGIIKAGERSKVLRELVYAAEKDPETLGSVIKVLPYKAPEGIEAFIKTLPADMPEGLKTAFAETFVVSPKGDTYPLVLRGQRVFVQVNNEINASLDAMQFNGWKQYTPENTSVVKSALLSPVKTFAKGEKGITGMYSIYRDLLGGGLPLDAIEIKINSSLRGYKFSLLKDPIKGFFALYNGDPLLKDLTAYMGGQGFRYSNPMALEIAEDVSGLIEQAAKSGIRLRVTHPAKALFELAGNLSNASRAGLVLRNKDRAVKELAGVYNDILGDPAKTGSALGSIARLTGFMNYPMQANRAQIEAIMKSTDMGPKSAAAIVGGKALAFGVARAGALVTVPTALLWYLTKDDEDIRRLRNSPNGRRYMYMPNPFDPEELLAIRRPQGTIGVLTSLIPEMMLDELYTEGKTDVIEQIAKGYKDEMIPNLVPLLLNSGIAAATGKSLNINELSAYSVVPKNKEGMMAEDQGNASVTNTAQYLAQRTGFPAAKWDRVFKTFLIGTSFNAYQQADQAIGGTEGKLPVQNQFTPLATLGVRKMDRSMAGQGVVGEFYDKLNQLQPIIKSLDNSINTGQTNRTDFILANHLEEFKLAHAAVAMKAGIDSYNTLIRATESNEALTPEDRLKAVREYRKGRTEEAEKGLALIKEFEKSKSRAKK